MSEKTFEKEIKDALVSIDEKIDQIDKKIDENIKKISKQIEQILPTIGKGKEEKKEETREKKTGKESLEAIGERIEQVEKELNKRVKNVPKYLDDSFKKISKQIDQLISQIKEVEKEAESSVKEERAEGEEETKMPTREEILDALKEGKITNTEALELLDQISKEKPSEEEEETVKEGSGKKAGAGTEEFVKKSKDSIEKALSKLRGRASRLFEQAGGEEKEKTKEGEDVMEEEEGIEKEGEEETKMPTREEILDALKEGKITNTEALELLDQISKEKPSEEEEE